MANWYGMSRSNYFRVKDEAAFRAAMIDVGAHVETNKDGLFAVFGDDEGYWPSYDGDTDEDYDFVDKVAPHLADDEIAVFITVGNEKSRYGTGVAEAFNNKNEREVVDIQEIYHNVAERWGVVTTEASY